MRTHSYRITIAGGLGEIGREAFSDFRIETDGGDTVPVSISLSRKYPLVVTSSAADIKLRYIRRGKFTMGLADLSNQLLKDQTAHPVEISRPFYLGQTEVTRGQFRQFVQATGYKTDGERAKVFGGNAVNG